MAPISGETCDICGDSLGSNQDLTGAASLLNAFANTGEVPTTRSECLSCQQDKPHFAKATAYGAYDGGLRELIHLLKYERVEPAADVLGGMLAEAISKLNIESDSALLVPVPLFRGKRRERGFNQAELIARNALQKLCSPHVEFATDLLERTRATVSQIGLTRPQRIENLRGAFRVTHLSRVKGRDVLLVDDVMTTGTTASECARVLRKAGAGNVWIATVARALKNQTGFEAEQFAASQAS